MTKLPTLCPKRFYSEQIGCGIIYRPNRQYRAAEMYLKTQLRSIRPWVFVDQALE